MSSTTRVEATFSDRRSSVANSSTAGNAAKSSGLRVNMATSRIITDKAMLKVNSRSSRKVGSGSTIMPSTITIRMGPASSRACTAPLLFNMVSKALIPQAPCAAVSDSGSSSAGTASRVGATGSAPHPERQERSWKTHASTSATAVYSSAGISCPSSTC